MGEQALLEALIAKVSARPLLLARLARTMFGAGKKGRAREISVSALKAAPNDAEVRSLAHSVLSQGVAAWYFAIVRDEARNAAFEGAIRRAVTPTTKVLEIGAGTAMFAMMAARAGATQVVTCEQHSGVADAARDVVALNGYSDRVRVLAKSSQELDPDADLGGPADLLIRGDHDQFGCHQRRLARHRTRRARSREAGGPGDPGPRRRSCRPGARCGLRA